MATLPQWTLSLSKLREISSEGQGRLVCCIPMGCKESDMTEQLNSNNYIQQYRYKTFPDVKQVLME